MKGLVGPETRIISLLNGVTSKEAIAARYGWKHLVLAITQGMDAVFIDNVLTYSHAGEIRLGAAAQTEAGAVEDIADLLERAERHGLLVPQNRWLLERLREIEPSW